MGPLTARQVGPPSACAPVAYALSDLSKLLGSVRCVS
jgi:hypothetical protein